MVHRLRCCAVLWYAVVCCGVLCRLSALVCRNALLELSQDLVTAKIRKDTPGSLAGIWPLLSLFNHSCAPNAVAVTIGGRQQRQEQQQTLLQQPSQQQRLQGSRLPVNPWAVQQQGGSSSSSSGGGRSASSSGLAARGSSGGGGLSYCADAGVGPFVLVRTVSDLKAGEKARQRRHRLGWCSGGCRSMAGLATSQGSHGGRYMCVYVSVRRSPCVSCHPCGCVLPWTALGC